MRLLKFLFTGRMSLIVFVLLAVVVTLLYLGWINRHQKPIVGHRSGIALSR